MDLSPQRGRNAAKRREWITVALRAEGFLSIAELTDRLGVSHMMIRRDLQYQEESGHVRMVHGGASLSVAALNHSARWVSPAATDEAQIGKAAANLIGETDIIAIDAGRIGYEVAKALPDGFRGTVITNSIPVIQLLITRFPAPRVVGVGGEVMTDNYAFVGASTLASIAPVRVETLFLAIDAVDERGIYTHTDAEASVKRAFLDIADRTVVVAGHDCFADSAPLMLGSLSRVAILVTDWRPEERTERALQEAKVDVLISGEHRPRRQPVMEPITRLALGIPKSGYRGNLLIQNKRYSLSASVPSHSQRQDVSKFPKPLHGPGRAAIRATHSTQEYTMAGNSTDPGRSVTNKVTAILMAFSDGAVLTLTEIAGIAKLPTSTAHRLASELVVWHLLERTEEGGYRIGLPLRIIGKDATDFDVLNRAVLVMRAQPVLCELARTIRTDAKLGALQSDEVVYLGQSGPHLVGVAPLSPTRPAHATAIGKALLAFSPTSVVDRVLAEGVRATQAVTEPDKIRHALSVIRLTQIATARDEYRADRSAIAMPVFSGGGKVAAAVELTVREPGTDLKAATCALTVACRSLSRQLATELRDRGAVRCNGNGNGSTPACEARAWQMRRA